MTTSKLANLTRLLLSPFPFRPGLSIKPIVTKPVAISHPDLDPDQTRHPIAPMDGKLTQTIRSHLAWR